MKGNTLSKLRAREMIPYFCTIQRVFERFRCSQPENENKAFFVCTEYRNVKDITDLHLKLTNDNHML